MARPLRETQEAVLGILKNLSGLEPLKDLFWSQLNYERVNESLSRRGWGQAATEALAEDPVLFAAGATDEDFHVIYARLNSPHLRLGLERPAVSRLLQDHPYSLFVVSNDARDRWHFVNVRHAEDVQKRRLFRRITISREERLRTASERLAMLDLAAIGPDLFGLAPLAVQQRHDEAFNVEAVTTEFYKEYKSVFDQLWADLAKQTRDKHWAHDYALQFLNRCMFLYFVQRKRWLGDDPDFLSTFWTAYGRSAQPGDSFFPKWLTVLFFEAFNNRFQAGRNDRRHLPDNIRAALAVAPYLNGGLFAENDLDRRDGFTVTDRRFEQVFTFLERYNFTIAEDSPLDQEVAVDPEMIGKVYESLVNVSEEADERGDAGIFYTPRTEIDLMCRLALVDNLSNHLGAEHKNLFYELVFALDDEEKQAADANLVKARLWPAVDEHLRQITVCDPAAGSGSFLVGMLHILDDLEARAARHVGRTESPYDRKKRIIGQNLYGVDVMEWACHVAELRLWLALIIDAEMPAEELHARREPLLPHFSFKIRCGDSLVQEVGGINLAHRRGSLDIPKAIKDRLRKLQNAKLGFYNNLPDEKLKTESQIKNEEVSIFRELLADRAYRLTEKMKELMRQQAAAKPRLQKNLLTGKLEGPAQQFTTDHARRESQIATFMDEVNRIEAEQAALRRPQDLPLVWDIAFAEVMESDDGGFDIVVGNPPYVRQESISDPRIPREDVTAENKRTYKAKLARSVYQTWPRFFEYRLTGAGETVARKLDAKNDLYTYFYFHGLSLLNDTGSFCFITSNSWLDVGYGADLQELLLRHGHARFVVDNQVKRSFKSADINTVIVLLARPDDSAQDGLSQTARFVMFKVDYEAVLSAVIFEELEETTRRVSRAEFRVNVVRQETLLDEGCEPLEEDDEGQRGRTSVRGPLIKVTRYIGSKWGGKYLRAPDIYWTIMDKGQTHLAALGDVAEVRRGFTSGANAFFYLDAQTAREWRIESRFLRPLLKGPKNITSYQMSVGELSDFVFYCQEPKDRLKGTKALEYVAWGESQAVSVRQGARAGSQVRGFHRLATVANRSPWYSLPPPLETRVFLNKGINDRHFVAVFDEHCACDQQVYQIKVFPGVDDRLVGIALNSVMTAMFAELIGRCNFGQGVLWLATYEVAQFPLLDIRRLAERELTSLDRLFAGFCNRAPLSMKEEIGSRDRRPLDDMIFDVLALSQGERDAVYEAVINLVDARLKKAQSL